MQIADRGRSPDARGGYHGYHGSRFIDRIDIAVCLFEARFKVQYQKMVPRECESWILGSAHSFVACTQDETGAPAIDSGLGPTELLPGATCGFG